MMDDCAFKTRGGQNWKVNHSQLTSVGHLNCAKCDSDACERVLSIITLKTVLNNILIIQE